MNDSEKLLLVELLLRDIRGNWGWENEPRDLKAQSLLEKLENKNKDTEILLSEIKAYSEMPFSSRDGRYFRETYPYGYLDMDEVHGMNYTFKDKSQDFKQACIKYLTYPYYLFKDVANAEEWTQLIDNQ